MKNWTQNVWVFFFFFLKASEDLSITLSSFLERKIGLVAFSSPVPPGVYQRHSIYYLRETEVASRRERQREWEGSGAKCSESVIASRTSITK